MLSRKAGNDSRAMQKVVPQATAETVATVVESVARLAKTDKTMCDGILHGNGDNLQKFVARHVSGINGAELTSLRSRVDALGDDIAKAVNLKKGGILGILSGLFRK